MERDKRFSCYQQNECDEERHVLKKLELFAG